MTELNAINREPKEFVDPDPYTIMTAWMAAASLILQFVQTASDVAAINTPPQPEDRGALSGLENELRNLQLHLKNLRRAISRGAQDPDKEFYDLKFKIGIGILKIERNVHHEYGQNLSQAYARIANTSLWINQIIANNPHLANRIGTLLSEQLKDSTDKLNSLAGSDASNRSLMFEAQRVIDVCEIVVGKMLDNN